MQVARMNDENVKAVRFWIEAAKVHVETEDGREAAVPIEWYPRLAGATHHDLHAFRIMGGGRLIHWPLLEEALGIETILHGIPGEQPSVQERLPRAARIKALRTSAKVTQVELAQRLGCSQALVSMAEKGKTWVGSEWEERVRTACASPHHPSTGPVMVVPKSPQPLA